MLFVPVVVQSGESHASRGARQRLDQERRQHEEDRERRRLQREAEMDPEELAERERARQKKRREVEARQRKRAEEEAALNKTHKKLDKEEAKKTANRLEYLFKQSPIFAKLKMGKGSIDDAEQPTEEVQQRGRKPKAPADERRPHHIHDKDSAGEEELSDEDEDNHVFLTQQPTCIKHGKLKEYQLESLNWMIHLAEKGLNGILADEVNRIACCV